MPDALSATFAALADPTRRAILARLASGACSVTELTQPFEMSMPAVSKHLRVLERAGLVARGREAQWRPCRLEAAPLKAVADWAEQYRSVWEGRLDRLDSYLQRLQASAARESADAKPARRPRDGAATRRASRDEWRGRSPEPSSGRHAAACRQIAAGTPEGRPAAARESADAKPARRPRDGAATRPASRIAAGTPEGRPAAARESADAKPAKERTHARHAKRRS